MSVPERWSSGGKENKSPLCAVHHASTAGSVGAGAAVPDWRPPLTVWAGLCSAAGTAGVRVFSQKPSIRRPLPCCGNPSCRGATRPPPHESRALPPYPERQAVTSASPVASLIAGKPHEGFEPPRCRGLARAAARRSASRQPPQPGCGASSSSASVARRAPGQSPRPDASGNRVGPGPQPGRLPNQP